MKVVALTLVEGILVAVLGALTVLANVLSERPTVAA